MFLKRFKVLRRRYTKNGFVTLLVSGFVIMTLKLVLVEHNHIEKASNRHNLEEHFDSRLIAEKKIETRKRQNKASDPVQTKLKGTVIYDSKLNTTISSEKPSTISKCGYDVS